MFFLTSPLTLHEVFFFFMKLSFAALLIFFTSLQPPVILTNKPQLDALPCACLYYLSTDIMMSEAEQKKNNYHFLSDYIQQMSGPTCGGG